MTVNPFSVVTAERYLVHFFRLYTGGFNRPPRGVEDQYATDQKMPRRE